ncbi:MAG TPA: FAD-dependent monooxygenase [Burkholderiaceae bacterium]|nr:FAD-dependent monooxygenase [Burkholderiaceae bacterium]
MAAAPSLFDVAVVGTGVVGLAAALGCAHQGLRVALIGPLPRPHVPTAEAPFDPRIYALAGASIRLLEDVRAWSQVDPGRIQPVVRMQIEGDAGGSLSFDAYAATVDRLATIVEECELLRALWIACGFAPAVSHLEDSFEALDARADVARVRLAGGRWIETRLVLGADGRNSPVRAAAGLNTVETPFRQTAVVANFGCAEPHRGVAHQWFTAEGVVALLPLAGRHASLVWSAPQELAAQLLALPAGELALRVKARTEGRLGELAQLGQAHGFALCDLRVDHVVTDRLVLLGDAAHVVHPLAGQGLNLGLQDVAQVCKVLSEREAWRDLGELALLRRHERARAEPVGLMRLTVNSLARLFETRDPAVRWLRNQGLDWVQAVPFLKNLLVRRAIG